MGVTPIVELEEGPDGQCLKTLRGSFGVEFVSLQVDISERLASEGDRNGLLTCHPRVRNGATKCRLIRCRSDR
jgi:hypothetical protein